MVLKPTFHAIKLTYFIYYNIADVGDISSIFLRYPDDRACPGWNARKHGRVMNFTSTGRTHNTINRWETPS